ncbi:SDR family oxidoreductase [Streptomyces sp. NPDC047971]|uniref:SDR family oxidoreductase n=1 Tax=Streptomyces sp. NPDC047971 TaxID=3154499 RepID=UPI0033C74082
MPPWSGHHLRERLGGEFDDAAWDSALQVNLKAVFHLVRFLRPLLEAAAVTGDPARVVNIGSVDGLHVPSAEIYSYAASKAAMHHLTGHLAGRLAPRVAVNAIALGPFESDMLQESLAAEIGLGSPMRRPGGLDDLAGIIQFLGSRGSAYLTGTVIPFDGGLSITR